jgi:hypothetical protein
MKVFVYFSQVANPSVRANAAAILFDVFPLNDSTANVAQSDELLQRQFDVIGVSILQLMFMHQIC